MSVIAGMSAVLVGVGVDEDDARAFLHSAGVSLYHLDRYYDHASFIRAVWLTVGIAALGALLGLSGWRARRRLTTWTVDLRARFSRLLIHRASVPPNESVSATDKGVAFLLLAITLIVLIAGMGTMPIRCDEANMYTSVCSSVLPLWAVAYISPNNHVGYAGLVWTGSFVWDDSVVGMRVFSLIAWLVSCWILLQIQRQLFGVASPSLVLAAASPTVVITLGILARGYALSALLIYAALLMALRSADLKDAFLAALPAGLAVWVVPSAVYGIALILGMLCAAGATRESARAKRLKRALTFAVTVAVLVAILYLPVVVCSGWDSLVANEYVKPIGVSAALLAFPNWLADVFGRLLAPVSVILIAVGGIVQCLLAKRRAANWILPVMVAGSFLLPLIQRAFPPARAVAFLMPIGLVLLLVPFGRWRLVGVVAAAFQVAILLISGVGLVRNDISGSSPSAPEAATAIARSSVDRVQTLSHDADYACLRFYLARQAWKGRLEVTKELSAPWVFESNAALVGEDYRPTAVTGLMQRETLSEALR